MYNKDNVETGNKVRVICIIGLVKRFENPKLCYNIWREKINKILAATT